MITVRVSNRLPILLEALIHSIQQKPLPPFEQECIIITENQGLHSWLELQIAQKIGCAASFRTPSPRAFSTELVRRYVPQIAPQTPSRRPIYIDLFERKGLTWRIARHLETLPNAEMYQPLHNYLENTPENLLPLASRIAKCFDDYQVYRTDVLESWQRQEDPFPEWSHSKWQASLWRTLFHEVPDLDRATGIEKLISQLASWKRPPENFPKRISVFGALVSPPLYLRVLHAISRHIPVTYYVIAPTKNYSRFPFAVDETLDLQPNNFLLQELGERGREFFSVLEGLGEGAYEIQELDFVVPPRDSLLHTLQADIIDDVERLSTKGNQRTLDPDDRSLTIHDCHSPLRELEVLRDQLLDAFANIPDLRPDQVQIVLPDIDTYAPLVDAVFGKTQQQESFLPYHIVGRLRPAEERVFEAVRRLLSMSSSRLSNNDLLELLDYPVLRQGARIHEDELEQLQQWLQETHVHWGSAGVQKSEFQLPTDNVHTWVSGLEQLLLGYAMGEVDELVCGRLPHSESNMEKASLLGRFSQWVLTLHKHLDTLQGVHTLRGWSKLLVQLLHDLLRPMDRDEVQPIQFLRETFGKLNQLHLMTEKEEEVVTYIKVEFSAVWSHLEHAINLYSREERHITGGITFVNSMKMRYVPYRVIGVVGLNDGIFPRAHTPSALDLQKHTRKAGDFAPRSTDRQLFLDLLTTAQDRVILTFVGRSQKDNSERAPSVVIDTVLDSCRQSFSASEECDPLEQVTTQHHLQPFNPAYFDPRQTRFFSYASHQCIPVTKGVGNRRVRTFLSSPLSHKDVDIQEVRLDDLVQAWINPCKYFCTHQLGLRLGFQERALKPDEPVRLEGLESYAIKARLLRYALQDVSNPYARLYASGALPPGELGRAWFAHLQDKVTPLANQLKQLKSPRRHSFLLEGESFRVTGSFDRLTEQLNVLSRCSSIRGKDLIRAWITHLVLNALAEQDDLLPQTTQLLGEGAAYHFAPLENPREHLESLTSAMPQFQQAPPPLFELASYTYMTKRGNMYEAKKAFSDGFKHSDTDDLYISLCFRGRQPLNEEVPQFQEWSQRLWDPILRNQREGIA